MYGLGALDAGDRAEKIYAIICATCTPSLLLSYVPCSFRFQQNNVVRGRRPNRYASGDTLLSYEAAQYRRFARVSLLAVGVAHEGRGNKYYPPIDFPLDHLLGSWLGFRL